MPKINTIHQPVMLAEVLDLLRPTAGASYLDLTAGYGGHAAAILEHTGKPGQTVLVDRDPVAATALVKRFGKDLQIIQNDFVSASRQLAGQGKTFDMILADLGVSSPHLDQADRGFSISQDGPLDMRMDLSQDLTAADIVNQASERDIADILKRFGQEPKARQIAELIVRQRPIHSTAELANLVKQVWPGHSRRHPATRTFQALRIAVNDELPQLAAALPIWLELLKPGGRLVVISYHSGEDRLVKQYFRTMAGNGYDDELKLMTTKPLQPSANEIAINPRSRSAKLRAVVKIKKKGSGTTSVYPNRG